MSLSLQAASCASKSVIAAFLGFDPLEGQRSEGCGNTSSGGQQQRPETKRELFFLAKCCTQAVSSSRHLVEACLWFKQLIGGPLLAAPLMSARALMRPCHVPDTKEITTLGFLWMSALGPVSKAVVAVIREMCRLPDVRSSSPQHSTTQSPRTMILDALDDITSLTETLAVTMARTAVQSSSLNDQIMENLPRSDQADQRILCSFVGIVEVAESIPSAATSAASLSLLLEKTLELLRKMASRLLEAAEATAESALETASDLLNSEVQQRQHAMSGFPAGQGDTILRAVCDMLQALSVESTVSRPAGFSDGFKSGAVAPGLAEGGNRPEGVSLQVFIEGALRVHSDRVKSELEAIRGDWGALQQSLYSGCDLGTISCSCLECPNVWPVPEMRPTSHTPCPKGCGLHYCSKECLERAIRAGHFTACRALRVLHKHR